MTDDDCPLVLLTSGQTIRIHAVLLYDERRIREIEDLKALAAAKFGPVSSGIGFIGSPGWVLGGAAVLSLLEGAAAKRLQREGIQYLQQAQTKSQALIESAAYCDVSGIANGHLPHPELWAYEMVERKVFDVSNLGWNARNDLLKKYNKSKSDIQDGELPIEIHTRYVHNGDEFLRIKSDIGEINIRWSAVVAYAFADRRATPHISSGQRND